MICRAHGLIPAGTKLEYVIAVSTETKTISAHPIGHLGTPPDAEVTLAPLRRLLDARVIDIMIHRHGTIEEMRQTVMELREKYNIPSLQLNAA